MAYEPTTPPETPNLAFRGFVRVEDQIEALLSLQETSQEKWVSVGDRILGWTVVEVSDLIVKVEREGFEHIVEINQ